MTTRYTLDGDSTWHNIGTGPATVQVVSPDGTGASVMVLAQTTEPTDDEGLVLGPGYPVHHFTLAQTLSGSDFAADARTLDRMGLAGMDAGQIRHTLEVGFG